ncbi:MAG: HutD family protein [Burkholderiaceae bacterium]
MTLPTLVSLADVAPQAWRNGGGRTRELLRWPLAKHDNATWVLRISVADIESDGPFSVFPGVQRWFAVIDGVGVVLHFADGERALAPDAAPLRFDGGMAPGCTLVDGPTRDLNLMVRGGAGRMQAVEPGVAWDAPLAVRALYTAVAGTWHAEDTRRDLAAGTLLWSGTAGDAAWQFDPADAGVDLRAWWLGVDLPRAAR